MKIKSLMGDRLKYLKSLTSQLTLSIKQPVSSPYKKKNSYLEPVKTLEQKNFFRGLPNRTSCLKKFLQFSVQMSLN